MQKKMAPTSTQILLAAGTGVALGICATVIVQKLTSNLSDKLSQIMNKVEQLQSQLDDMKVRLSKEKLRNQDREEGFIIQASPVEDDEDEDEFVEAIEGSEFEPGVQGKASASGQQSRNADSTLNTEELFEEVDKLLDGGDNDKNKAYNLLHSAFVRHANDPEFLWRYAKATYNVSLIEGAQGRAERKKEMSFKALSTVTNALQLDDRNASSHKWFAITIGSVGDYQSIQEKIQNGYKFKQHIERSISLNPDDPSSHYLLGRWCYGVYMLSWVERKVAATLFASPPTATVDEALKHFSKAQELQTARDWKENMLFISKCHIEKKNYFEAAKWLRKAKAVPVISQDDKTAHVEVESLLKKYEYY